EPVRQSQWLRCQTSLEQVQPSAVHPAKRKTVPSRRAAIAPGTAAGRDLLLGSRAGERLNVDFELARFVRLVRDPFAIRSELRITLIELRLNDYKRLSIPFYRQRP